jgi:hypothetical protein
VARAFSYGALQGVGKQLALVLAPDHWGVEPARVAEHPGHDLQQAERCDRVRLPFQRQRLHPLDRHGITHKGERLVTDQDLPGLCGLLEAGGHVDGIARRKCLSAGGIAGYDFAGVDTDASADANAALTLELVV